VLRNQSVAIQMRLDGGGLQHKEQLIDRNAKKIRLACLYSHCLPLQMAKTRARTAAGISTGILATLFKVGCKRPQIGLPEKRAGKSLHGLT
jgi:hypothetical protein